MMFLAQSKLNQMHMVDASAVEFGTSYICFSLICLNVIYIDPKCYAYVRE